MHLRIENGKTNSVVPDLECKRLRRRSYMYFDLGSARMLQRVFQSVLCDLIPCVAHFERNPHRGIEEEPERARESGPCSADQAVKGILQTDSFHHCWI